jgi:hypothetical protein
VELSIISGPEGSAMALAVRAMLRIASLITHGIHGMYGTRRIIVRRIHAWKGVRGAKFTARPSATSWFFTANARIVAS